MKHIQIQPGFGLPIPSDPATRFVDALQKASQRNGFPVDPSRITSNDSPRPVALSVAARLQGSARTRADGGMEKETPTGHAGISVGLMLSGDVDPEWLRVESPWFRASRLNDSHRRREYQKKISPEVEDLIERCLKDLMSDVPNTGQMTRDQFDLTRAVRTYLENNRPERYPHAEWRNLVIAISQKLVCDLGFSREHCQILAQDRRVGWIEFARRIAGCEQALKQELYR